MAIALDQDAMKLLIEQAVARARQREGQDLWTERVERLGAQGFKTYIAALGGALLAKATDPDVDSLVQDRSAGPRGYSLRMAAELLAAQNHGRFHLGATGRNPLNNRPFLGGPGRIDRFEKISSKAAPAYAEFLEALRELNTLDRDGAFEAFVSFLTVRMRVAEADRVARDESLALTGSADLDDLLAICERFVGKATEGGKKGQAFVAAVLDCAFPEVVLQPINNPNPADVRVLDAGAVRLAVEVKQVPVSEGTAFELAGEVRRLGADSGLLVVLAPDHSPLDRDRIRDQSIREHGITVEVCESVRELVGSVAVFAGGKAEALRIKLPTAYAHRMREHDVGEAAQSEWRALLEASSASAQIPSASDGRLSLLWG